MEPELRKENLVIRMRNILNENGVKLWTSPYFNEDKPNLEAIRELASKYSEHLKEGAELCQEVLLNLQQRSLRKIEQTKDYKNQGLATIRIKVSGKPVPEFSVQLKLTDTGEVLKQNIATSTQVPPEKLKLICNGRVMQNEVPLLNQNVKHGSVVLALILQNEVGQDVASETREHYEILEATKRDLELLGNTQAISELYPSITNQIGAEMKLPREENKVLVTAMTLHEKGRSALKRQQYSLALLFFLEAENEFKICRSDILNKVDNFALLNLDIVWTYFHLQSLHHLADAEARLKLCEQMFYRCYGSNLERLNDIKGSSGNERVLLVRLRLLKAILSYFLNRREESLSLLEEVENGIRELQVDKANMSTLRSMGYSSEEARLALRATYNNLEAAVQYIIRLKEEKEAVRKHEKIRRFVDHHVCRNGWQINMTVLEQLHSMGYTRLLATQALMNSNNEINDALLWITNFIDGLKNLYPIDVVDAFKVLEFSDAGVEAVLKKHQYKLTEICVCDLLATKLGLAYGLTGASSSFTGISSLATGIAAAGQSSSSPSTFWQPLTNLTAPTEKQSRAPTREEFQALNRLREDIPHSSDDYLDLDLESEEKILKLYKSFLS